MYSSVCGGLYRIWLCVMQHCAYNRVGCIHCNMDTILYLYPVRQTVEQGAQTAVCKSQPVQKGNVPRGKLLKIFRELWKTTKTQKATEAVTVRRTEYLFRDYRLVRAAVTLAGSTEQKQTEQILREQLQELTEDPDHTYIVCREPLSFYYGREFREYLQQEWVEHLLAYGEKAKGEPLWRDLIVLGHNPFLPYVILEYAQELHSMKWYLTAREFREDEERLTWELEDEYGLIPEIRLLPEAADYDRVRLEATAPCVVLDFCDSDKVYGGGLAAGSVWLDFPASEEKERRVAFGCPQIRYFSMKKEWKDPRKALEYLDTISKNGYNNPVD